MLNIPSFRLDHKRALVVGASSGIGQGCAVALGAYGADVTVIARRLPQLQETVALIEQHGGCANAIALDVTDIKQTQHTIDELCTENPFDILVNAAGIARNKSALDISEEDFDRVAQLNIKSAYFITQTVAKHLIKHTKPGSLMTISSQMGHVGGLERSTYCASKHALEGMTKAMAMEWGEHNIRINTICPTFIKTALTKPTFENPKLVQWLTEKIKLDRLGEVEDIMGAVVFLASDASSLITGTSLLIDGGWTAG